MARWLKLLYDPKDETPSSPPLSRGGAKAPGATKAPIRELRPVSRDADPRTDAALRAAVEEEAKLPGFSEFKVLFDTMAGLPEAQRVEMALRSTHAAHDISASSVRSAIEERLGILDTEIADFTRDLEEQGAELIAGKTREKEEIAATIADKRQRIQELEADIARLSSQEEGLDDDIAGVEREKAMRSSQFSSAHQSQKAELQGLLDKLPVSAD